ncbi:MAG: zinc ABC transporter substrate-binding protein [Planctomycetaceae bacterium]|nr:zinc ABC transporter substrate-binding protein [Planctomycetaceae bacterium]
MTHVGPVRLARSVCLSGLLLVLAGCGGGGTDSPSAADSAAVFQSSQPYRIVTTVGMVTDIVRTVAGDRAEVFGLMGPGVDPHLHSPSRDDVNRLLQADVVIYGGLNLEGKMTRVFEDMAAKGRVVFAITDGLPRDVLRSPPEFEGHFDPHVWMDVSLWSRCAEHVAQRLAELDPPHAAGYAERAAALKQQLKQLDEYARTSLQSIPEQRRVLVTAHDAFGYFSTAYGIPSRSVQGLSTESEASVADINALVKFISERGISAVFIESSIPEDRIEAVLEGVRSRGGEVRIGGELYSDAMGPEGQYEGTYIGMIDHNVTTITRALGGQAPTGGMNGKLRQAAGKESTGKPNP